MSSGHGLSPSFSISYSSNYSGSVLSSWLKKSPVVLSSFPVLLPPDLSSFLLSPSDISWREKSRKTPGLSGSRPKAFGLTLYVLFSCLASFYFYSVEARSMVCSIMFRLGDKTVWSIYSSAMWFGFATLPIKWV